MMVDKKLALEIWHAVFGDSEWAIDCFGAGINREAYSNETVLMRKPGDDKPYDYSWNIDHIRPVNSYRNKSLANILGNYEPMHRQHNLLKGNDYPYFSIDNRVYTIIKTTRGYGFKNSDGYRVDWKARNIFIKNIY